MHRGVVPDDPDPPQAPTDRHTCVAPDLERIAIDLERDRLHVEHLGREVPEIVDPQSDPVRIATDLALKRSEDLLAADRVLPVQDDLVGGGDLW